MLKHKKKILFLGLVLLGVLVMSVPFSQSRIKSYYSGEAFNYNNTVYIGTTNTGDFELFALEGDKIVKKANIHCNDYKSDKFFDLKFTQENNRFYVYLVNGRYIYKYDITKPSFPIQEFRIKDNTWYWFMALDQSDKNLATIGSKGKKIWNEDMQVINTFKKLDNERYDSVSFSSQGRFIFHVKADKLEIFDTDSREVIQEIKLETKESHQREIYNDPNTSLIYVVDDESVKAFDFGGRLRKEFNHTSSKGYDIVPSAYNNDFVYFSDGVGIVKSKKSNLDPVKWRYTTELGVPGGWAMDMEVVPHRGREKVVVFNGNNILVMDENLDKVAHYEAKEKSYGPIEDLFLKVDKNRAAPGSYISLRGGGFKFGEKLEISFAGEDFTTRTNDEGRFVKVIQVPSSLPTKTDIKVIGEESELSYSLGFIIE